MALLPRLGEKIATVINTTQKCLYAAHLQELVDGSATSLIRAVIIDNHDAARNDQVVKIVQANFGR